MQTSLRIKIITFQTMKLTCLEDDYINLKRGLLLMWVVSFDPDPSENSNEWIVSQLHYRSWRVREFIYRRFSSSWKRTLFLAKLFMYLDSSSCLFLTLMRCLELLFSRLPKLDVKMYLNLSDWGIFSLLLHLLSFSFSIIVLKSTS
jgi:hypothetical protein